jgi:argininosuccinate lyase
MPQKKNPDVCELTRGKTGRLVRQPDEPVVASKACRSPTTATCRKTNRRSSIPWTPCASILAVNTEMIAAMELRKERCRAAASDPMLLATDLADIS